MVKENKIVDKNIPNFKCHLLPCTINYKGNASVKEYFEPLIRQSDNTFFASFRGRPLNGATIELPKDTKGRIFERTNGTSSPTGDPKTCEMKDTVSGEASLECVGKFSQFTYWNLDKIPDKQDSVHQVLKWIEIAKIIHSDD